MKNLIIILSLLLIGLNSFASKDRPIRPILFEFILSNNDTIICGQDSILEKISYDFLEKKITFRSVKMTFKTQEAISITYTNKQISSFYILKKRKRINVPTDILKKLTQVNYASFITLYNQYDKEPFNKNYFLLRFSVGLEVNYNKYNYISLVFRKHKYFKGHLVKQTGKDSRGSEEL